MLLVHILDDRVELCHQSIHPSPVLGFHLLAEPVLEFLRLGLLVEFPVEAAVYGELGNEIGVEIFV